LLTRNLGFHGAGIWGGQPSIDSARNQIFFASGNLYGEIPAAYKQCTTTACMPADVYQDSIFAVDLTTGKANWQRQMSPLDGWSFACIAPYSKTEANTLCPSGPGPDADIAMAPTFIPAALGNGVYQEDTIIVGQKSGLVYCMKASDGTLVWTSDPAPPENKGGFAFGMAADDVA
jgi:outer membrane protein assembly factor BamB